MSLDMLFENTYPHETSRGRHEDDNALWRRMFEVHVTRSHFGDLLIVAANTRRQEFPKVLFRDEWTCHQFPQMSTPDGWNTRFNSGERDRCEPQFVVALLCRGVKRSPDECEYGFYDFDEAYALVQHQKWLSGRGLVRTQQFMEAPGPGAQVNIVVDDGLEAIHAVMLSCFRGQAQSKWGSVLAKLESGAVPEDIAEMLSWGVEHVTDSFGQGRIPRKSLELTR